MGVVLNPYALPGIVASTVALAAAVFVLATGRGRGPSRALALVLAVEGFLVVGTSWMYVMTRPEDAAGLQAVFVTAMIGGPVCYLFLIATLDTPLVKPLRTTAGRVTVVLLGLAAEAWWLAHPSAFIPRMVPVWYAPWEAVIGEEFQLFWTISGVVSLFSLTCAIDAHRRSPRGSPSRERAKFYAVAFGARDVSLFFVTFLLPFMVPVPPSNTWTDMLYVLGYPVIDLAFVGLLLYGVLKVQLFDIDLKIKLGVSRGVLASIFVAVFFVVSQVIQTFAAQSLGYLVGAVASGLLLFALRPLERVATRVADAAMPQVRASSDYVAFRKMHVYRAALEGAYDDGEVTQRERAMLVRLADELGIRREDADALERDVAAAA